MVFQNNILSGVGGQGGTGGYTVDYSCRFDGANKGSLYFTPTTSSAAQKTYTLSAWVKRGNLSLRQVVIGCADSGASAFSYALMAPNAAAAKNLGSSNSGNPSSYGLEKSDMALVDPTAWFHIMLVIDTTEAVDTDRANIYYNGVKLTGYDVANYPPQDSEMNMNHSSFAIAVGTLGVWSPETAFDGYIAQPAMVTELALTPTDFGEFDANNVWRPIDITGLDYSGTNSFLLDFADSSNLGNDVSGNDNDLTNSGLEATDQGTDTPTKNFATYNPLNIQGSGATFEDGNLVHNKASTGYAGAAATIPIPTTGKWAFKIKITGPVSGSQDGTLGIYADEAGNFYTAGTIQAVTAWYNTVQISAYSDGGFRYQFDDGGANEHYDGPAAVTDDEFEFLVDRDAGTVDIIKNGSAYGTQLTGLPSDTQMWPGSIDYATNTTATFDYTPSDTDYLTLCTANLPAPTIKDGTAHFQPTLYTGDGSVRSIDQTGNSTFQPDFVWIKNRSAADNHMLIDAARGVTKELNSDRTTVESTDTDGLTSFDSDGFGLGTGAGGYNDDTETFVAWQWKAGGGAGSANAIGSITTTTTTVNTTAGISIGTFTGTGANATVGHGLGVAPKMIILKCRNDATGSGEGDWYTYHGANTTAPETDFLELNSTAATSDDAIWQDTAPTSTVFSISDSVKVNVVDNLYIVYCFAEIEGFSRFSNYTGNGLADGAYIFTGFKPSYVMIKKTSGTGNWVIMDSQRSPYNEMDDQLLANTTAAETTGSEEIDFLSNGFKIRTADSDVNTSAGNYVYAAFAEYPFGGDGVTPATAFGTN